MKKLAAISFLLLSALNLQAQKFSGSVEGAGAWNFQKNNDEKAALNLNYDAPKWYLHSSFGGGHNFLYDKEVMKASLNTTGKLSELNLDALSDDIVQGKLSKLQWEDAQTKQRKWNFSGDVDAGFRLGRSNLLSFNLGFLRKVSSDTTLTMHSKMIPEGKSSPYDVLTRMGVQMQSRDILSNQYNAGVEFSHNFHRFGRKLSLGLSTFMSFDIDNTSRVNSNIPKTPEYFNKEVIFRAPSSLNDINFLFQAVYSDDEMFLGVPRLKGKACLMMAQNNDLDAYTREDYENNAFKKALNFDQLYSYSSLTLEPRLDLSYSIGAFDFNLDSKFHFYDHILYSSSGSEEEKTQEVGKSMFYYKTNAGVCWSPSKRHNVTFNFSRNITHPEYEKISSIIKVTDTEGEYFKGNPNLMPQKTNSFFFKYTYRFRRVFELYASLNYKRTWDKAEKVVDNKTEGITYYTYVNSGLQQTPSFRLDLKGSWEKFRFELYTQTNVEIISYKNIQKEGKTTFNWEMIADASYLFPKSWTLSVKGGYASPKETAFTSCDSYISTNVRLSKTFFDRLDVYLEGRDLADREVYEYNWNEALDYCKITCTTMGRRSVALGVKYKF